MHGYSTDASCPSAWLPHLVVSGLDQQSVFVCLQAPRIVAQTPEFSIAGGAGTVVGAPVAAAQAGWAARRRLGVGRWGPCGVRGSPGYAGPA